MDEGERISWVKVVNVRLEDDPENFLFYWGRHADSSTRISNFEEGTLGRERLDAIGRAVYAYNNMDPEDADQHIDDLGITVTGEVSGETVINHILSEVFITEEGLEAWWTRSRMELGGATPREMLHEDTGGVVNLALSALMQEAT